MHSLARRAFLEKAAWAATATSLPRWAWSNTPAPGTNPFALGIASGDPTPDGVVLWTRLIPADPGTAVSPLTVHWEVADDAAFGHIVHRGQAQALPEWGHSVHVELQGLKPDRWYHYRFHHGGATSATGRTRTAPALTDLPARLRVVFASCQRWEHGYYAAWCQVVADAPDLVLFLGDYIYEYASPKDTSGLARVHSLHTAQTLADYRDRYALHKSDPLLQAAHAACPWSATWDDHEVQNDYAGQLGRDADADAAAFAAMRVAGWQAFYEHMPLRASSLARGIGALQVYRGLSWGRLAQLHLLDARQFRQWQACRKPGSSGAGSVRPGDCAAWGDPTRTVLGAEQEQWLDQRLADSAAASDAGAPRWSVIAQQTLFSPRHHPSGKRSTDTWDGYPAARERLLQSLQHHPQRNTVLLGGDIHQNYVCNVLSDPERAKTPVIASEFCGTSISSRSGTAQDKADAIVRHNPHVLLARCEERGYGLADITPQRWTTTLRVVDDPLRADSSTHTQARFVVEDRVPGPQRDL